MTKQDGVDVWPNAAIWMRDELRSKVRSSADYNMQCLKLFVLHHCYTCTTFVSSAFDPGVGLEVWSWT